jgi:hypothetical protein
MNGYTDLESLPSYRELGTSMTASSNDMAKRITGHPILYEMQDEVVQEFLDVLRYQSFTNTIAEIEAWAAEGGHLKLEVPAGLTARLKSQYGRMHIYDATRSVNATQMRGIVETVKNRLLDLTLEVEEHVDWSETSANEDAGKVIEKYVQNNFYEGSRMSGDNINVKDSSNVVAKQTAGKDASVAIDTNGGGGSSDISQERFNDDVAEILKALVDSLDEIKGDTTTLFNGFQALREVNVTAAKDDDGLRELLEDAWVKETSESFQTSLQKFADTKAGAAFATSLVGSIFGTS